MRLAAAVVVVLGCSDAELAGTEQAIVGGAPAANESAVVGLARHPLACAGPTVIDCTATLVAPRVVVTAAHCLGAAAPNVYQVFFGASVADGGTLISIAGGRAHPEFDPATFAHDIAALILAEDAPAGIVPVPLRTTPLPDLTGTDVTIVGFGVTAVDAQDTGVRRSGVARVTAVADEIDTAPGPAIACSGDSGGPVLAGGELIGVSTHGDAACAQVGHAWRIDREQPFLTAVIAEASSATARRPFDPDEELCATACSTDAECPDDTVCFGPEPRRCVYRGLPAGTFAEACPGDGAPCVTVPDGSCRLFTSCDEQPPGDGCGCRTSSSSSPWWLLALLLSTRGARRAARSLARTASTCRAAWPRRSSTHRR